MKQRKFLNFLFVEEVKFWYFKYIVGSIILSLLVIWLTVFLGFSYADKIIAVLTQHSQQTSITLSLDTVIEILRNTKNRIFFTFLIESIVLIIIGVTLSLYLVHRIVGPLKRIDREIDEMISGKVPIHKIVVRRKDYVLPYIDLLNKLIEKLK